MNYILKATLLTFLIISLSACETGFFVRDSHSHYCGGTTNFINHVKLKHPAECPAESPVKQSSLKKFCGFAKKDQF
jgi:hypothetical protein